MPKYYCDYCDVFLTHDTLNVRRAHNNGWKHKTNVRAYYSQFLEDPQFAGLRMFGGFRPNPPPMFMPPGVPPPNIPPPNLPPGVPPPHFRPPPGMPPNMPPNMPPPHYGPPPGMPPNMPPNMPQGQNPPAQGGAQTQQAPQGGKNDQK